MRILKRKYGCEKLLNSIGVFDNKLLIFKFFGRQINLFNSKFSQLLIF